MVGWMATVYETGCVEKLLICPGGELWEVVVDTFAPSPAPLSV